PHKKRSLLRVAQEAQENLSSEDPHPHEALVSSDFKQLQLLEPSFQLATGYSSDSQLRFGVPCLIHTSKPLYYRSPLCCLFGLHRLQFDFRSSAGVWPGDSGFYLFCSFSCLTAPASARIASVLVMTIGVLFLW